jgi:2'-5' RNA ligase
MFSDPARSNRINSYALVTYLPEPLGSFLDNLSRELVPGCGLRSHVTVLPPRHLLAPPEGAWRQICEGASSAAAFDVELTEVRVFPVSGVIYLEIGAGMERLMEMHRAFNAGLLEGREIFDFHPHVTLAQEAASVDLARRRWADYPHPRTFRVENVTFVQNTVNTNWSDIGQCQLGAGETRILEPVAAG